MPLTQGLTQNEHDRINAERHRESVDKRLSRIEEKVDKILESIKRDLKTVSQEELEAASEIYDRLKNEYTRCPSCRQLMREGQAHFCPGPPPHSRKYSREV